MIIWNQIKYFGTRKHSCNLIFQLFNSPWSVNSHVQKNSCQFITNDTWGNTEHFHILFLRNHKVRWWMMEARVLMSIYKLTWYQDLILRAAFWVGVFCLMIYPFITHDDRETVNVFGLRGCNCVFFLPLNLQNSLND